MTYRKVNGRVVTRRGQQLLKLFVTQTYTMPKRKHDGTKTKADRAKNGTADAPAAAATAEGGQKERYTFFFTAASPFSQWHPCEFTVDGVKYTCAEQFMMHQKAVLFKDDAAAAKILKTDSPKEQKALGRQVKNFDEVVWKENCRTIVRNASRAKFSQNADLRDALMATGTTVLVEAAPRDRIWGIGLGANNPKALNKNNWRGRNWLGYILTDVREELRKQEAEGQ